MTEMLRTPSKAASLYVRRGAGLPEGEATDIALEQETAVPLRVLVDAEHGSVVVLSDDDGASVGTLRRQLLVATDILAVAAAGVQEESARKGANEGVDGLEELGGGGGEVGAEVAVGAVDEGGLDLFSLARVMEDPRHAEGRVTAAGREGERGDEDEPAPLAGLAGHVEEGAVASGVGEEQRGALCRRVAEISLRVIDVEPRRGVCECQHKQSVAEGVVVQMERERGVAGEGTHQNAGVWKGFVQDVEKGVEVREHEKSHGFPGESLRMRCGARGFRENSHLVVTVGGYRHPRVPSLREQTPSEMVAGERGRGKGHDRIGR